jgi:carbon monoxide dehydrogenase subunit G
MEIKNSFDVPAGADEVWRMFQDVPALVACMPGVELTEQIDANTYVGAMNVRLGPMRPAFEGEAHIEFDETSRTGTINAKGKDRKGGSRANARVEFVVRETSAGSTVDLVSVVDMMGQLAQFGRTNILADVSAQLTSEFAECLAAKVTAPTREQADSVHAKELRLFSQVLALARLRIRRAMRRLGKWLVAKSGDE